MVGPAVLIAYMADGIVLRMKTYKPMKTRGSVCPLLIGSTRDTGGVGRVEGRPSLAGVQLTNVRMK